MTGMDAAMQAMFVLTAVRYMLASARRQLATLCGSLDATLYEVLETGSRGHPMTRLTVGVAKELQPADGFNSGHREQQRRHHLARDHRMTTD
jgi:hypothetical protein